MFLDYSFRVAPGGLLARLIGVAFVAVAAALACVAYLAYERQVGFEKVALRAQGIVVGLRQRAPSKVGSPPTFAAVVDYVDSSGATHEFVDRVSNYPPRHAKGEKVDVRYLADDPHNASLEDFMDRFGFSVVLSGMSAIFALVGSAFALVRWSSRA